MSGGAISHVYVRGRHVPVGRSHRDQWAQTPVHAGHCPGRKSPTLVPGWSGGPREEQAKGLEKAMPGCAGPSSRPGYPVYSACSGPLVFMPSVNSSWNYFQIIPKIFPWLISPPFSDTGSNRQAFMTIPAKVVCSWLQPLSTLLPSSKCL